MIRDTRKLWQRVYMVAGQRVVCLPIRVTHRSRITCSRIYVCDQGLGVHEKIDTYLLKFL